MDQKAAQGIGNGVRDRISVWEWLKQRGWSEETMKNRARRQGDTEMALRGDHT